MAPPIWPTTYDPHSSTHQLRADDAWLGSHQLTCTDTNLVVLPRSIATSPAASRLSVPVILHRGKREWMNLVVDLTRVGTRLGNSGIKRVRVTNYGSCDLDVHRSHIHTHLLPCPDIKGALLIAFTYFYLSLFCGGLLPKLVTNIIR